MVIFTFLRHSSDALSLATVSHHSQKNAASPRPYLRVMGP